MSPRYSIPGVYFEGQDLPRLALPVVRTDVAGFVGVCARGPFNKPVEIKSWDQFQSRFGGPFRKGYLASAVQGFFDNEGRTCWVVRAGSTTDAWYADTDLPLPGGSVLHVTAVDPGDAGEEVYVKLIARPRGRVSLLAWIGKCEWAGSTQRELWQDLLTEDDRLPPDQTRYITRVLADEYTGSALVRATVKRIADRHGRVGKAARLRRPAWVSKAPIATVDITLAHLTGVGAPPGESWGLAALAGRPDVSIVAIPDLVWREPPPTRAVPPRCADLDAPPPTTPTTATRRQGFSHDEILQGHQALIGHCESLQDRFAILDLPDDLPPEVVAARYNGRTLHSSYAAAYYPWIYVEDRLRLEGVLRAVPPSGAVAGVMARVDTLFGVHKAPANERIRLAQAVSKEFDEPILAMLHEAGINSLVSVPARGVRIAGARTLTPPLYPEWRYISTRRLFLMVESAVRQLGQQIVFESNTLAFQADLARLVGSYLGRLWREGKLDGDNQEEAFFVRCDETNNPAEVVATGQLVCEIGLRVPSPAEFVIVRVGVTVGEAREVIRA